MQVNRALKRMKRVVLRLMTDLLKRRDGPLRGAMPGMKLGRGWGLRVGLRWSGWMAAGLKVHAGAGVPSVVTGSLWTVRGR